MYLIKVIDHKAIVEIGRHGLDFVMVDRRCDTDDDRPVDSGMFLCLILDAIIIYLIKVINHEDVVKVGEQPFNNIEPS